MNFTLDASVFISAFQKGEKNHLAAREILAKINTDKIALVNHALFFFEILCAIQRKTGDSSVTMKTLNAAKALPMAKYVPIDRRLYANQETFVTELGLRGADAIYLAVAKEHKARLLTFDREILVRAEKWCMPTNKFLALIV